MLLQKKVRYCLLTSPYKLELCHPVGMVQCDQAVIFHAGVMLHSQHPARLSCVPLFLRPNMSTYVHL